MKAPLRPKPVPSIEDWQPNRTTLPMVVALFVQLAATIALLWQVGSALGTMRTLINAAPISIAAWIAADFISGRFHKYIDAYGDENTPLFGEIIVEFAHHHRRPKDAARMPIIPALWGEMRFTAPLCVLLSFLEMNPLLKLFLTVLLTGIAVSQVAHNLAHIPPKRTGYLLMMAQELRIFLRHTPHMVHHAPPHSEAFEPLCGVCSWVLKVTGYNRAEERLFWYLFRAAPRTWLELELAPPSYLNSHMHYESAFARLRYDITHRKLRPDHSQNRGDGALE